MQRSWYLGVVPTLFHSNLTVRLSVGKSETHPPPPQINVSALLFTSFGRRFYSKWLKTITDVSECGDKSVAQGLLLV